MIFADKLITLRKKAGWSQEKLAEKLNVTRQSVSKWEGAQSVPDIDKILQLSGLFGVTTDYLLKDDAAEPEYTEDDTSPLPRVTLAQANDYLAKAKANAPRLALATALCVVSPIPLLALGALSEAGLFGIWDDLAGGIGLIALLVIIAAAVAIFMQCSASVRAYEFLQKQAIETEYGVTGLAKERRDAFAPQYDKANILGTVLCVLSAVPVFAAMMVGASFLVSASICLVLALVACGVYAFVRVGTVRDAMDQLLEEGDYTRPNKAIKSRINALTAAYWLVVVAIFLWYTFGPQGNGQPQYTLVHLGHRRRGVRRAGNCGQGVYEEESVKIAAPPTKNGWGRYFCRDVGARHAWPGRARQTSSYGKAAGRACPAPTIKSDGNAPTPSLGRLS